MSPLGITPAPDTTNAAAMVMTDQFDDDEVFFTPLISPAMTPSHPYSNLPHALSTANEIFSPLTSPALQPHRTSAIDYLSFSGQSFTPLPMQLHQAQSAQQQLQQQLQKLQSQPQPELSQQQQQTQQQNQSSQASSSKSSRIDVQSPALNAQQQQQRPSVTRKPAVERTVNGLTPAVPRSTGPVRGSLSKNSPALRPIASPMSPSSLRKQQASRPRSSPIAPASPLVMHFPTNRPTPSPLLISTSQPTSTQPTQASPSPRLVTNMHQLSMVPSSPLGIINPTSGPLSPALFALPASSMMMPPPRSPMILPSASQSQMNTQRQLSLVQPQQPIVQNQHQLSTHQPVTSTQPSPALKSIAENSGATLSPPSNPAAEASSSNGTAAVETTTPTSNISKSALAPVTPASLMNLGAGSGSETTPTSSPKFGVHAKAKSVSNHSTAHATVDTTSAAANTTAPTNNSEPAVASTSTTLTPAAATGSTSGQKRGTKRQANGDAVTGSGVLAPSTPRQVPLTPGSSMISPMPPPANGFSLISPALKPTLMTHRGSNSMMASPRMQPLLVSPSLKPWIPGVSPSEAMARLASKSNYQNILDGDHTALGLSYNTDLHSGIELRRTSHKAAEQKRRDSLKNCFDDLRQMIPNIQEKSPSKVFLLKKSFDYICNLKAEVANRDLELARIKAEHEFMKKAIQTWITNLPEDSPLKTVAVSETAEKNAGEDIMETKKVGLIESWTIPEEELKKAISKETDAAARAAEVAEMSALAVEAARTQPGGQSKGGKESQGDPDDSDDDGSGISKNKKSTGKPGSKSVSNSGNPNKKANKGVTSSTTLANASSTSSMMPETTTAGKSTESTGKSPLGENKDSDATMELLPPAALPLDNRPQSNDVKAKDGKTEKMDEDEDGEDDDDDAESEDQEMADAA
ncbi:hypothetical protein FBU30_005901 [Linnemannia zychae]|nr:hypothetical protein FBU30_005901 [Linnemannia zychae]